MKIKGAQVLIKKDPRLSAKQKLRLEECLRQDPKAEIFGVDANRRPVVRVLVGIPPRPQLWAISKDGEPTDVRWEAKEGAHDASNLAEPWREVPKKKKEVPPGDDWEGVTS